MALTTQQGTALVAGLKASTDPVVIAALSIRNDVALNAWCNSVASPAVKAWHEVVTAETSDEACDWTLFDAIVAGKRDSWGFFLSRSRDFSKNKVRKWITDVWGNATASSAAEAILQAGLVNMTNAEVILGGTTDRTTGTVTGRARSWYGTVGLEEMSRALNLNP